MTMQVALGHKSLAGHALEGGRGGHVRTNSHPETILHLYGDVREDKDVHANDRSHTEARLVSRGRDAPVWLAETTGEGYLVDSVERFLFL